MCLLIITFKKKSGPDNLRTPLVCLSDCVTVTVDCSNYLSGEYKHNLFWLENSQCEHN